MSNVVYMDQYRKKKEQEKLFASFPVELVEFRPRSALLILPPPAELVFPAPKTWLEKLQDLLK